MHLLKYSLVNNGVVTPVEIEFFTVGACLHFLGRCTNQYDRAHQILTTYRLYGDRDWLKRAVASMGHISFIPVYNKRFATFEVRNFKLEVM